MIGEPCSCGALDCRVCGPLQGYPACGCEFREPSAYECEVCGLVGIECEFCGELQFAEDLQCVEAHDEDAKVCADCVDDWMEEVRRRNLRTFQRLLRRGWSSVRSALGVAR